MRVVARRVFVAVVAGQKRVLDLPHGRLGTDRELEVLALYGAGDQLNTGHTRAETQDTKRRTVILSQYL